MKGLFKVLFAFLAVIVFLSSGQAWSQAKRDPDTAYDPVNNRYLMVWEEADGAGSINILGQFRNPDSTVVPGTPALISDPRPTQGCFYGQFDSQNGDVTTPTNCPENKNPSVAFNNGQYIVVWEVRGTASAPASAPDNQFVNIFAQIIDANTLNPLPGWDEGILISKVFIAANNAESSCGDRHACNDGQIQAWSQSINPDVAPRIGGQGFIVTWQTNKDFIGCADSDRRRGWAVYGRYIDQNFSATSTTNPPAFAVYKDDSTMSETCETPSNVDNGTNPRIAVNQTTSDFVIAYEVARASGGNASIGAKRVTLDGSNVGQVNGRIMPDIVASVSGSSLNDPEIVSFKNQYILFASDGSGVRAKAFSSSAIASTEPSAISLGGGAKTSPRASSNLGAGGQRSGTNTSPERILLTYENGGNVFGAVLNEGLSVTRGPENISTGVATDNQNAEVSSDIHNFIVAWKGQSGGENVFAKLISSADGGTPTPSPTPNVPPTAPVLLTPNDGTTFAPVRAYLSWNASNDTDGGTVTYRIYFGENVIPATPQVTGITDTHFIIGPETIAMSGITLQANRVYKWKVEADDGQGGRTSSPVRTLNTDNSVVGWWRFDENPTGPVCVGGGAGETICDFSGNNNHGIPIGGPTWLPPPDVNLLGGGLLFDGINDSVSIQNNSNLNFSSGSQFAVETRLRPNVPSADAFIVSKGSGGAGLEHGNYSLAMRTSLQIAFTYRNTDALLPTYSVSTALTPAVYNHILISYTFGNGLSISSYINGVLSAGIWRNADGSAGPTGNEPPTLNTQPLVFSSRSALSANFFPGSVDEIILYSRLINSEESVNHYNSSHL